jgi:hypothetical protein
MNKFINALLLFITLPTALISIYVGFDLPVTFLKTTGANIPYIFEVFLGLGLILMIIIVRRSIRRWMGIKVVSRIDKFKWNEPVSSKRKIRVITYLLLETAVMTFAAGAIYYIADEAWPPALALLLGAIDNFLFAFVSSKYRVGLSSKALIIADREVIVLYFTGLRKVSIQQQTVYFDYIKDLQITFPSDCIQEDHKVEFFETLEAQLDRDKVFFSHIK